ncbi:TlpA family protein disulfide reductase [Photobacterium atrarenae]|uniref:TlpA family protein disulfide reductase n=1 Tax=Photobacterium atrarenae TaxID=865757 RepID=A0ABY5GEZ0_9GAMM|nr:TlpA disulfide reductase family protein [Photobacterium atrarenae]UTV27416.1 TlpA family protein disulfide reductase [Photobacterium atrarenae]
MTMYVAKPLSGWILSACLLGGSWTAVAEPLVVGQQAPAFEVTTLDGRTVDLQDYRGKKPVYLKFWATWCSYCKAEMPHFESIYQQYGDAIEVLSVNIGLNDSVANIEQFYQQHGYQLPTVFDRNGELSRKYQVVGTPYQVLIDKQGKIAYQTFLATDQLDDLVSSWGRTAAATSDSYQQ